MENFRLLKVTVQYWYTSVTVDAERFSLHIETKHEINNQNKVNCLLWCKAFLSENTFWSVFLHIAKYTLAVYLHYQLPSCKQSDRKWSLHYWLWAWHLLLRKHTWYNEPGTGVKTLFVSTGITCFQCRVTIQIWTSSIDCKLPFTRFTYSSHSFSRSTLLNMLYSTSLCWKEFGVGL